MADNSLRTPGVGETIASDDVGGVKYQRVKISVGPDGTATDLRGTDVDGTGGSGIIAVVPTHYNGSVYKVAASAPGVGDNASALVQPNSVPYLYNETTYDRGRGNTQGTLLASAARTAQTSSPTQTNYNARGVVVFLNVTAASGTGGLQPVMQGLDPVSGNGFSLNATPTAVITTGTFAYVWYPGAVLPGGGTSIAQVLSAPVPRTWAVTIVVGNATSYTYSLGYSLIL